MSSLPLSSRCLRRRSRDLARQFSRGISTSELDATKGDRERVVILGSGWAGFTLSRQLDSKKFQPVVVSPRSYFVFTPLLASTAVGTLEFRNCLESVRGRYSGVQFFQGWADDVNFSENKITIEEAAITGDSALTLPGDPHVQHLGGKGKTFELGYDKLVVAVGCYSQTFGTKGVSENAFFLKDIGDSRKIRKRILDCFELASLPSSSEELRKQILNFAIVGGGPTGVEFSAELHDLCNEDLKRLYPDLIKYVQISIYDVAPSILNMFDKSLADYALEKFKRDGIQIKTNYQTQGLRRGLPGTSDLESDHGFTLTTKQDGDVGVGMCVWSTGLMMNPFIRNALDICHVYPKSYAILSDKSTANPEDFEWNLKRHAKSGGLIVNDKFQVELTPKLNSESSNSISGPLPKATMTNVFALGDVCVMEKGQLPATAQVANQQAKWLGKRLNKGDLADQNFSFKNLGVMAYLGNWKAIMQTGGNNDVKGWAAWFIWRGAYLTKTVSWRNKLLIPIYWVVNWIFGRDISRF